MCAPCGVRAGNEATGPPGVLRTVQFARGESDEGLDVAAPVVVEGERVLIRHPARGQFPAAVELQVREARLVAFCQQSLTTVPRSEEAAGDREGIGTVLLAVLEYLHTQKHFHWTGFVSASPTCMCSPASDCRACSHAC